MPGSSFVWNDTADLNLYAQWAANRYIVSFNANGGSVSTGSKTVTYDSTYGTLPVPSRTGYTFNGWYTLAEGGSLVSSNSIVKIIQNTTLYAQWTPNSYTVSFNANGGTGAINGLSIRYLSNVSLPSSGFTKQGFVLRRWNTAADGSGINYQLGGLYTQSTTSIITLYAIWEEIIQDINKTPISRFDTTSVGGGGDEHGQR